MKLLINRTGWIKIARYLSWILVILLMAVIFMFSDQTARESDGLSKQIASVIKKVISVTPVVKENNVNKFDVNHWLRKSTHFLEYFLLSILLYRALLFTRVRARKSVWLTILICAVYAAVDELHQKFVPGRGPMLNDVGIDLAGILAGILLVRYRRLIFRKLKKVYRRMLAKAAA